MIETERLRIIPLEFRHLNRLREMRLDFSTWHWLTDPSPISEASQQGWFDKMTTDSKRIYLAIENKVSGGFIGVLRSDEYDHVNRSIRIGVDIDAVYRNKGFGTEAMRAFMDYLFSHMNIHRIWLLVASPNLPAKHLYQKLNFVAEGKQREALFRDGQWTDYEMMSVLEEEWTKNIK